MHAFPVRRRSMLAAGAALVGAAIGRRGAAAAAPGGEPRLGIQMYSLRGYPVDEALAHVKDLGLEFIELYPGMFPVTEDLAKQVHAQDRLLSVWTVDSPDDVRRMADLGSDFITSDDPAMALKVVEGL